MPKYAINRVVLMVLAVIALVVVVIVFVGGLIRPNIPSPLPEDKARFLRYLSCAYAMCVKGCGSAEVINIPLEEGKKSCNDVCVELKRNESCKKNVIDKHVCGSSCYLEFVFNKSTTYSGDSFIEVRPFLRPWVLMWRVDTDLSRYEKFNQIRPYKMTDECFQRWEGRIVLDGHEIERGCPVDTIEGWKAGLCEGILENNDKCAPGNKSGNWIPKDRFIEDCRRNTGHIWFGPDLVNQCGSFKKENYLRNCTFEEGQKIYIWAEIDSPLDTIFFGLQYCFCPELVVCSHL